MPDVVIVTVNFHTETHLALLAASVAHQSSPCRLLIADNGSSPDGRRLLTDLARQWPFVELREAGANIGYFAAADQVVSRLSGDRIEALPDWLVVCNPDVELAVDFAERLMKVDADVVAPRVADGAGGRDLNPFLLRRPSARWTWTRRMLFSRDVLAWAWILGAALRARARRHVPLADGIESRAIYAGHGSVLAFRRSYFARGGTLQHPVFLFGEEITVAEQVARTGSSFVHAPSATAVHVGHAATGRLPARSVLRHQREATRYVHALLHAGR